MFIYIVDVLIKKPRGAEHLLVLSFQNRENYRFKPIIIALR